MKVCVLFYNLGGYHLSRLAAANEACLAEGWELSVIEIVGGTAEHPWGAFERPGYVKTLMPFRDDEHPTVGDPELLKQTLDLLLPDVLAIPGWGFDFSRIAMAWGRHHNCDLILMSESKQDDAPRNFVKELIKKHMWVKKFDAALVGGEKHIDYLVHLGLSRKRIFTGYDVVDNEFFEKGVRHAREAWKTNNSRPSEIPSNKFFLAANRFIQRKNLPRLVRSFAKALNSDKIKEDWDLVLLGDGAPEQKAEIVSAIDSAGIRERVHLPGFVQYDSICDWYAAASVFVHPALSEQWGLVVNEAMAAGLPILLSNACGCHPELMEEGVSGFSFDPYDEEDICQKMIDIACCNTIEMGKASKFRVNDFFSPTKFGSGLVNAIHSSKRKNFTVQTCQDK